MKKILFLTLGITLIACKEEAKPDYAIISGVLTNKTTGDISINSSDRTFKKDIKTSNEGAFIDTLSIDIKDYVLYDGKNPVFLHLEAGYNLAINYDIKDFENSLTITGNGADINNYFIKKRKTEKRKLTKGQNFYTLNETDFKTKFLDIKNSQEKLLDSFNGIANNLRNKEKRNLNYFFLSIISDYEGAHKYYAKKTDFKVSKEFLKELEGLDYSNEEDYNYSNNYRKLVRNHYNDQAKELAQKEAIANDIAYLKTVSSISNENIKNGLLFESANNNMNYSKDIEHFYKTFMLNSTNEKNKTKITENYNKLTALSKGKPSPKFISYENHKGGITSLDDLKGKYIYIDVWATWCGPCKQQIPFLKDVEQKYHNKNIEFVSVSIDKKENYNKWKTMVDDEKLGGIQLLADNDWSSSFVKDYQIKGIPRFILIDTEGNIVEANAPRPSDPKLIELFTSLSI